MISVAADGYVAIEQVRRCKGQELQLLGSWQFTKKLLTDFGFCRLLIDKPRCLQGENFRSQKLLLTKFRCPTNHMLV